MPPTAQDRLILNGLLGLETNVSQHSGDPKTFRVFKDLVTDVAGRIIKRDGRGPTLGSVAGTEVQALWEYVFVDPATGIESYHVLGAIDGGGFIYRFDGVNTWTAQTLPIAPTLGGVWGFATLGSFPPEVVAFNGIDPLLIARQPSFVLASLTSVGVTATGTTSAPHTFVTGDSVTISGAVPSAYNGTYVITVTGPTTFTYVFAGGASPASGTIVASALSVIRWRIAGQAAPSFAPAYSLIANDPPYTNGTVSGVKGSPTIRSIVGPVWSNVTMPGHRIGINGNIYTISTVDVFGAGTDQVLTLTEGLKEDAPDVWKPNTPYSKGDMIQPTASVIGAFTVTGNGLFYECTTAGTTGAVEPAWTTIVGNTTASGTATFTCRAGWNYAILMGAGDWDDIAPQYRFSYYNPITGHFSNPSPILQVTELHKQGTTITITIPASAENQAAYQNGYTKIQLFRTPKSAGIPVALSGKLDNVNSDVATITFIETTATFADTNLTDIQAPLKNYKPPSGFSAVAYQQGRGFAIHKPSGKVYVTPLQVEVDGRAIECWPPASVIDVPSGSARGLLVVGSGSPSDSLVIQSSRGDYSIEGTTPTTFVPYLLPTDASGGYQGAATNVMGKLIEFYASHRLRAMRDDIGQKIQDRLNAVKPALLQKVRVHWFTANSRNYVLISLPKDNASTANDYTYVFDVDLGGGPIYEWSFGISAFATVHDPTTAAIQLLIGDAAGAAYRLFTGNHQDNGADFAPTWLTPVFRGDELRGDIKYIKIFVNDPRLVGAGPNTLWTGSLFINEQTSTAATNGEYTALTFRQMDYRSQSAQGRELIATFTPSIRTKSKVFQVGGAFPNVNADLWIEQIIIGTDDDQFIAQAQGPGVQA